MKHTLVTLGGEKWLNAFGNNDSVSFSKSGAYFILKADTVIK